MKRQTNLSLKARIEKYRVIKGECWETLMSPNKIYPQIKIAGKSVMIHRASYEVYVGRIPTGQSVLHRCDNPRCHNPAHLFLGTRADNMQDMWNKKRHPINAPKAPYDKIAKLAATKTQKQIAEIIGFEQTTVSKALRKMGLARGRGTTFRGK